MKASTNGITFLSILALIFIGLKLAEVGVVAGWSWWAVLAPLWAPWAVALAVAASMGLVWLISRAVRGAWRR